MFSEDLGEPAQGTLLGMGTLEAASYCADPAQRRQFVQVSVRVVRVPTLRAVVCGIRELRQLRDENARLKRLVADLTLDRQVLQDVVKKKW